MIIDTGAKYGYGIKEVFYGEAPYASSVYDFNPCLRDLHSDMYHQKVMINGLIKTIDIGFNQRVKDYALKNDVVMVGNITTFFDEVCVVDIPNRQLILK